MDGSRNVLRRPVSLESARRDVADFRARADSATTLHGAESAESLAALRDLGLAYVVTGQLQAPGFGSPASAVSGFIGSMWSDKPTLACKYDPPGDSGACTLALSLMGAYGSYTGTWSIGNSVVSGSQAIVDVEYYNGCLGSADCLNNDNPNAGLPAAGQSFSAAYQRALTSSGYATDCVRLDGRWYVWNISK